MQKFKFKDNDHLREAFKAFCESQFDAEDVGIEKILEHWKSYTDQDRKIFTASDTLLTGLIRYNFAIRDQIPDYHEVLGKIIHIASGRYRNDGSEFFTGLPEEDMTEIKLQQFEYTERSRLAARNFFIRIEKASCEPSEIIRLLLDRVGPDKDLRDEPVWLLIGTPRYFNRVADIPHQQEMLTKIFEVLDSRYDEDVVSSLMLGIQRPLKLVR